MELVGGMQIEEMFKDMNIMHLYGGEEVPQGTQLIHRIECPFGYQIEDALD